MSDHMPECPLLEPCSADTPNHGFCSRQNTICIHCERQCICDRLRACEQRVTAAAVQRVEALFWFSDIAMRDQTHPDDCPWQPCLQLDGMCLCLGIWFASKDECDQFILSDVVRAGWKP